MNWKFWKCTENRIGIEIKDSMIKIVELQKDRLSIMIIRKLY